MFFKIPSLLLKQLYTFGSLANVYFEAGDHENLVHTTGEAFRELLKGARRGHFTQGH